jgi:methyltransferase
MSALYAVLAFVALQRVAELFHAQRNTRALIARGGIEAAREQYPWLVTLHVVWLLSMLLLVPAARIPNWWLIGLFFALQIARIWIILSLGPYWTTRLITVPGAPLIRSGPYRFVRHPNYIVVTMEIAILPLAFGAWQIALVFSFANAALLTWRIRAENRTLDGRNLTLR